MLDVQLRDCQLYGVRASDASALLDHGQLHSYNGVMLSRGLTNTPFALTSTARGVTTLRAC